jgi:hypothetical protein
MKTRLLIIRYGFIVGLIGSLLLLVSVSALGQEPILLSLDTETRELQTGQEYEVTIRVEGDFPLWLASVNIVYDPERLYILGTRAGSPVTIGSLFTGTGRYITILNSVQAEGLIYVASLLAPADPVTSQGVLGSFRIYPLAPGTTQLRFVQAELVTTSFEETDQGRVGRDPEQLPFVPVLLEVNVSGAVVEPPPEETATPTPSPTATAAAARPTAVQQSTLDNVTAAPRTEVVPTRTLLPELAPESEGSSPILILAVGLMLVGAAGLIGLILWSRRR